jgi:hypothetical protein
MKRKDPLKNKAFGASSANGFYHWATPKTCKLPEYNFGSTEDMTDKAK